MAKIDIKCISFNLFFIKYVRCGDISKIEFFFFDVYERVGDCFSIFGKVFNKR